MNKFKICPILIMLIVFNPLDSIDRADYEAGQESFKNKNYETALEQFKRFIEEYPQSVKADDSLWYIGRIYKRLDRDLEAEKVFLSVLEQKDSNRYEEAAYELGKIWYYRGEHERVIELFKFIDKLDQWGSYHLKGKELAAKSLYRLAYLDKLAYADEQARLQFLLAAETWEALEQRYADVSDISRVRFWEAKTYSHLADVAREPNEIDSYRSKSLTLLKEALPNLDDSDRQEATDLLMELEKDESLRFKGRITAMGGGDNLSENTLGSYIYANTALLLPMTGHSNLEFRISYSGDSFNLVSSNFDKTKTGDSRMVQRTDSLGADIFWRTGAIRNTYNRVTLSGDLLFAEDIRDNYWGGTLSDYLSLRIGPVYRIIVDSSFEGRVYPNYLIAGRKLDYIKGSVEPQFRIYGTDWLSLSLLYGFDLKQYLNSKYDTPDPAVPSNENKQIMTNSGEVIFDLEAGKIYNPVLSYKISYLTASAYNYWVPGFPSDIYIENYYDYLSHRISLDNSLYLGKGITLLADASLTLTSFLNYPARDETKTFTGEKRFDTAFNLDGGANFLLWTAPEGWEVEGRLRIWWDYKVSNMTYNTTFDTNYSLVGIMTGISVNLP